MNPNLRTFQISPEAMAALGPRVAAGAVEQRNKQILFGVLGAGGGAVAGMLLAPKVGTDKKLGALIGGGAGLLGALLVLRWS